MKPYIKLSEEYLKNLEAFNPAIHEEMEALVKEAEVEDLIIKRAHIPGAAEFKISDDDTQTVVGLSSTQDIDRDNEIVITKGIFLDQFRKSPVKLFNHSWHGAILPIGKVPAIKATLRGLLSKSVIGGNDFADQVWKTIAFGSLGSNSIGFLPTEKVFTGTRAFNEMADKLIKATPDLKKTIDTVIAIIVKSILLEDSIVKVPANPEAINFLMSDKSFGFCAKSLRLMGYEVIEVDDEEDLEELYERLSSGEKSAKKSPKKKENSKESVEKDENNHNTKEEDADDEEESPQGKTIIISIPEAKKTRVQILKEMLEEKAWSKRQAEGKIR